MEALTFSCCCCMQRPFGDPTASAVVCCCPTLVRVTTVQPSSDIAACLAASRAASAASCASTQSSSCRADSRQQTAASSKKSTDVEQVTIHQRPTPHNLLVVAGHKNGNRLPAVRCCLCSMQRGDQGAVLEGLVYHNIKGLGACGDRSCCAPVCAARHCLGAVPCVVPPMP